MNREVLASFALLFAATALLLPALTLIGMKLFGRRLRHATCYLILLLCVIRILIPTGWGPSVFQISDLTTEQTESEPPISNVGSSSETSPEQQTPPQNGVTPSPDNELTPSAKSNLFRSVLDFFLYRIDVILPAIWGIGSIAFACAAVIPQLLLLRRETRFSVAVPTEAAIVYAELCKAYDIKHPPTLSRLELAVSPHICGILSPSIRLGNTPLTTEELTHVLRHELTHYRRCDLAAKILLTTALAIFWWNPVVWKLIQRTQEELELSCDEQVLANADEEERCAYGCAILKVLRQTRQARLPFSSALSASGNATVTRFREITSLARRNKGRAMILLFCLVFLVSGMILGCNADVQSSEPTPPADVTDVFFLKGECDLTERQLTEIAKTLSIPPHEGMHMVGWNVYTESTANGGYSFRFEAALEPNEYLIRLVCNGGTVENQTMTRKFGSSLPNATREGCTFGGWYTDAALKNRVESTPASNATLYAAWLEETPSSDFEYTERNGSVVILAYRGKDPSVTVPIMIGGKPVTSISVNAFAFCTTLESVTLPSTVTQIGAGAFRYCYTLQAVTLGGEVTQLDRSVFEACYALTQINCPASVRVKLTEQLPASVTVSAIGES